MNKHLVTLGIKKYRGEHCNESSLRLTKSPEDYWRQGIQLYSLPDGKRRTGYSGAAISREE